MNVYHVQLFARFIERLRSTPDGDGSLLDHSLIVYGSGMSDGNGHTGGPLPIGGRRRRARPRPRQSPHRDARSRRRWRICCVTLSQKFGVEHDTFGVSTGTVDL